MFDMVLEALEDNLQARIRDIVPFLFLSKNTRTLKVVIQYLLVNAGNFYRALFLFYVLIFFSTLDFGLYEKRFLLGPKEMQYIAKYRWVLLCILLEP